MSRPRIVQDEEQVGFYWVTGDGVPTGLAQLVLVDDEPDRLLPTHLEALDDALIIGTGRFGEVLGGGRPPRDEEERLGLLELHRSIDRLCYDYSEALAATGATAETRAGQIIGTAALVSTRARQPLGLLGPAPFDGELDNPSVGVVSGFGEFQQVDPSRPWTGGRWVIRGTDGSRFPATLSMLLFDSSGVNKDAALTEHRAALLAVVATAEDPAGDVLAAACAIDWLLYDWLMAHRDGPDSGAVEIRGPVDDARMITAAAAMSVRCRARFDPALLRLVTRPAHPQGKPAG